MVRGFFKLVISLVLAVVVFISGLFAWGTTHNQRHGISWPVLLVSLVIGFSCLWGIVLVWRGPREDIDATHDIDGQSGFDDDPHPHLAFDDEEFNAWLSANEFDSAVLSPETMAKLRQRFLEQRG